MTYRLAVTLTSTALLLAACSGAEDVGGEAGGPVALVSLAPAEQASLAPQITLYGAAEPGPGGKFALSAPAEAIVIAIDAPAGTHVTHGSVVARLAPSPTTRSDLAKTTSDAQLADTSLARAIRLKADGLVSNADVETARAAAKTAHAARAAMAARTGGLVLHASGSGVVTAVAPAVGDLLQPGANVATITSVTDLRARFGVDPATVRSLHAGQSMRIMASAGTAPIDASIASVDPAVDPQTRLASVFARLPAQAGIGSGQTLSATVSAGTGVSGLSIPYAALLDDAGQAYVYVVSGNVAHRRDVTAGASSGDRVAVTGIKAGEQVIVAGGTAVEDGMKVRTK